MKKNSFVEGTFIATFAIILSKFLGMIYVIPFYAIIGEQGGALYAYSYNVYLLFLGISTAGLPVAISKIISEYNTLEMYEAKERTYKICRNIIMAVSVFAFFVLFVFAEEFAMLILGKITGGNSIQDVALTVRAVSFCLLIVPFLSISRGYLQGHKFITAPSMSQVIEQIVRIFIILAGSYLIMNVLNGTVKIAVSVSVFAAFLSALVAYIYLKRTMVKNKKSFNIPDTKKRDKVTSKQIIKKILKYSIPLIIVNTAINIYNLIDMVLLNRGLEMLGYRGLEAETIVSIVSTWAVKICMIINSIGMGLSVSLIPHITSSFVKKDIKQVNSQFNRAVQMVLVSSIPLAVGICLLADPVYTLFLGESKYGPAILSVSVFVALFSNLHIIVSMSLQAVNRFKIVYISTIIGFVLNAVLDIPMMYLFDALGFKPFYGVLVASIIGYSVSFIIAFLSLKKSLKFNYKKTGSILVKMVIPTLAMIVVILLINLLIPIKSGSFLYMIGILILYGIVGAATYITIMYKNGALKETFGEEFLNKILRKIPIVKNKIK